MVEILTLQRKTSIPQPTKPSTMGVFTPRYVEIGPVHVVLQKRIKADKQTDKQANGIFNIFKLEKMNSFHSMTVYASSLILS